MKIFTVITVGQGSGILSSYCCGARKGSRVITVAYDGPFELTKHDAGKVNKVMPKLRELALQSEKIRTPNAESCNITYCTGTPSSGPHSEKLSSKASV